MSYNYGYADKRSSQYAREDEDRIQNMDFGDSQQQYTDQSSYSYPHQNQYYDDSVPYSYPPVSPSKEAPVMSPHNYSAQSATDTLVEKSPLESPEKPWTKKGHLSRGSVALQAAAEGQIPVKEGLRIWREDEHAGVFTKGGRKKACLRCCCCTLVVAIVVFIGIVAAFLLWVRPPNVTFNGVQVPTGQQEVELISNGFVLNFNLNIGVQNPNFFGAKFKELKATAFYPTSSGGNSAALGGGSLTNVDIKAHSTNTLHFPFTVNYTSDKDPGQVILQDIAEKCGFIGASSPQNIKVNYDLELKLHLIAFSISPTFSSSTSFSCPLKKSDVSGLLGGIGG